MLRLIAQHKSVAGRLGNWSSYANCKINQTRINYRRARRKKTIYNQKKAAQEKDKKNQGGGEGRKNQKNSIPDAILYDVFTDMKTIFSLN
jgi:hypothetical protein